MPVTGSAVLLLTLVTGDPRLSDPRYDVRLVAADPDLVTPVGLCFDDHDRLLVIESHTHFRPENYAGPTADRIRIIEDADGDGKADRFRTYYEGTRFTMGLRLGPDGWVYVATRNEVFRLKDSDGDGTAETREEIARLETKGDYPHNGLSGLAVGPEGKFYVGLGENLGEPYDLVGRDGRRLNGGGEGGNVFRCDLDGSNLERIATGFWNPFGLCFDPAGRLFAVDNDPDASPPCRLLHVVPGGDYGFQFRYGRSGRHPLQAWDGELPGTLPMAGGTGEAPCAVLPHDGTLWVTSWGNHRIERFTMRPKGATVVGTSEIAVQGDENFRPVDLAAAPNGDIYFTDWVDKSYPLHGKGRLWRLRKKPDAPPVTATLPPLSDDEKRAAEARTKVDLDELGSADPFLHTAAMWGLVTRDGVQSRLRSLIDRDATIGARRRIGLLESARWRNTLDEGTRDDLLREALANSDSDVRLYAIRWIADERTASLRDAVAESLNHPGLTSRLFRTTVAALKWLEDDDPQKDADADVAAILADENRPAALRALALKMLPPDHPSLTPERLAEFAASDSGPLSREAVRSLALREPGEALARIAGDENRPPDIRADAITGLASRPAQYRDILDRLARSEPPAVAAEAARALAPAAPGDASRLSPDDLDGWAKFVGENGDPEAGWRAFFRTNGAACSRCHKLDGRGASVGPDLTGIGRRMDRRRLLESILRPSREVAPQYVPWTLVTTDGRVLVGLPVEARDTPEGTETFVGTDGKWFTLRSGDIDARQSSPVSLMPDGLEKLMTAEDLRDILALLSAE